MEAYRSGHNGPDSKSGSPHGLVGSNPTASASGERPAPNTRLFCTREKVSARILGVYADLILLCERPAPNSRSFCTREKVSARILGVSSDLILLCERAAPNTRLFCTMEKVSARILGVYADLILLCKRAAPNPVPDVQTGQVHSPVIGGTQYKKA